MMYILEINTLKSSISQITICKVSMSTKFYKYVPCSPRSHTLEHHFQNYIHVLPRNCESRIIGQPMGAWTEY